jgi:sigma-E factor negative regulatory protein RseC
MSQEMGKVTNASKNGWATVVTERKDACHSCGASQFCHALANCAKLETKALNKAGAGVDDLVAVHLSSHTVLKGALVLYLIPALGLLTGAVAGTGFSTKLAIGRLHAGDQRRGGTG